MTRRRVLLVGAVLVALVAIARLARPPLLEPERFSRVVSDRQGNLLRLTLAPDQIYRLYTPLEAISPQLVEATLAWEDRHFYRHPGVNPVALGKAFVQTFVTRQGRRGGSTLTMQLARLRWNIDSKTIPGKLEQIARALELELLYPKRALLEAYLNLAPYGGNVEGVGAASRVYFHKEASALSLPEAMALAVMPQSPTRRTPNAALENEALHAARLKLAAIYQAEHPGTRAETLALEAPLTLHTVRELPFLAPHAVERALSSHSGASLTLTLDRGLQTQLERKLAQYVERRASAGIHNAAAILVDVTTSEVLAHVGSADFFDATIGGQVDAATAPRSPGSALKPLVYARALDEGLIHPLTLLKDVPMRFGSYNPENFDSQYLGPMSATEALVRSRNVPAVDLNLRLQHGLHSMLTDVGVKGLRGEEFYGAGIVLGAVEVSMEELVQLYAALAHGGRWTTLRRVRGEALGPERTLVSPAAAELTLEMLSSNDASLEQWATPRDTVKVAWKTGTSYAYRDAWTVGVAGRYALAVWVGNFDGTPNPSFVGRAAAAPLFFDIIDGLRVPLATPEGRRPATGAQLAPLEVCAVSGKRPGPWCPRLAHTRAIPGVSPIDVCDVHRSLHVDLSTGLRRCAAVEGQTRDEVFEVWPSDIARLFARAGLARRPLPALAEVCPGDDAVSDSAPRILSPQPAVTYHLRRGKPDEARLPLLAHADGAAHSVTWFAGAEVLGTVAPGEPLDWTAPSGDYVLRAVDDRGNAARVTVSIRWVE